MSDTYEVSILIRHTLELTPPLEFHSNDFLRKKCYNFLYK